MRIHWTLLAITRGTLLAIALAWVAAAGGAWGKSPLTGKALDARIQELDKQHRALRNESREVSGTSAMRTGKKELEWELAQLRVRYDRLDELIEKAEANVEDLKAYKKKYADRSVFTASDAVGEGAEKTGEQVAKKALSKGAGRALGWLGIVGDVGEYGGKWVMKQGDVGALEDAVESSRVNLMDLYDVAIALSGRINDRIARIKRMEEIIARDDEVYPELAELRAKKARNSERATAGAVLRRETDAAGDREEARKATQRGVVSPVGKPEIRTQPPKGSGGVWVSPAPPVPDAPKPSGRRH